MEKGCGSPAIAGDSKAAGKLSPNPCPSSLRKRSSACSGRPCLTTIRYHATKQLVSEDGDQHLGDDLCSAALCEKVRDQDESGFFFGPDDPERGKSRASVLHS